MTRRRRTALFLVAAAALGFLLVVALADLPGVGHYHGVYGLVIQRIAVAQRKATDIVNSVTFDYRGVDTLGEEFILFSAAIGLVILLRELRGESHNSDEEDEQDGEEEDDEEEDEQDGDEGDGSERSEPERRHRETSATLRVGGQALVGPLVVLGVYVVTHGQLTPGGGFQGGCILAAALFVVYLAGRHVAVARVRPLPLLEIADALGAGGYAAIGIGGLISGSDFLFNFLPLGTPGNFLSGGTIAALSTVVGLEVSGAFSLVLSEFIDQRLLRGGET